MVDAISRAEVAAVTDPTARTIDRIDEAVASCDFSRAAVLALSRAKAGEEVAVEVMATILPGIRDIALAAVLLSISTGDRANAWLSLVRARRFPGLPDAIGVELVVLYAAWREGAATALIVPEARRISRTSVGVEGNALLYTLSKGIGDPNLLMLTRHMEVYAAHERGRNIVRALERALSYSIEEHLQMFPREPAPKPVPSGFTVRIGPRVGRNEPCPCGSGQKYKRCCADKDAQVAPSPVSGLSWDDYVTKAANRMSGDDVLGLSLRDLGRVDLHGLAELPLIIAFRRFCAEHQWDHAEAAVNDLVRRPNARDADGFRLDFIAEALRANEIERARVHLALLGDSSMASIDALEVDLSLRRSDAFDALAKVTAEAVRNDAETDGIDLAHTLLRVIPGLGILVARGCLHADRPLDNEMLLEAVEEARDALNLPPGDPAWDLHAALVDDEDSDDDDGNDDDGEHERLATEARSLRSSLRATTTRLEDLEQQLAVKQSELGSPRPATTSVTEPIDRERERSLRMKVEELQALVREGNTERGELRRQLAAASVAARPLPSSSPVPPRTESDKEEDGMELVVAGTREIAVPVVSRRMQDALPQVPRAVASEALRTLGALAAGDASEWRGVKQARDMARPILMVRIGIHHRFLFRLEAGTLEALDLVSRESLLATLKRIRAARA